MKLLVFAAGTILSRTERYNSISMGWQGLAAIIAVFLCGTTALAQPGATAQQLAAECDRLLSEAVRKPYGWAWPDDRPPSGPLPRGARIVNLSAGHTPAAALVLLWAGRELGRDDYVQAAVQAARGVAAAQQNNGRIPALAVFHHDASTADARTALAERSSTIAALGLLLAVLDENAAGEQEDRVRRSALRAITWLRNQQAPGGAWPLPDPQPRFRGQYARIVVLTDPDYRNSTLATLLALEVVPDAMPRRVIDRAIGELVAYRLTEPQMAVGLWRPAYELDGRPYDRLGANWDAVDMLATRHALQTLLAAAIMLDDRSAASVLGRAVPAVQNLRFEDGFWHRAYRLTNDELRGAPRGPARAPDSPFPTTQPVSLDDPEYTADFGLPAILASAKQLKALGAKSLRAALSAYRTPRQEVARVLAGVSDDLMKLDLPLDAIQARAFLASPPMDWLALDRAATSDTPTRARRVELLLLKLKVERLARDGPATAPANSPASRPAS